MRRFMEEVNTGGGFLISLPEPRSGLSNRPFPSSKKSHLQSEAKCEAIDMKMIFNYDANKIHFTTKVSHLTSF